MSTLMFDYTAVTSAGVKRKGSTDAASRQEAFRKLQAMGLTPIDVRPAKAGGGFLSKRSGKVSRKEISHFTYQLGVLISARIPLADGLASIAEQERDGALKDLIEDLVRRIRSGEQIAVALERHTKTFGPVYVATIRAAERSGTMAKVLEHLADMLERQQTNRSQVRGALMYPVCVSGVLVIAVTFLIAFVVPRFAKMFAQRSMELPVFTKVLVFVGESVQHFWWAYLVVMGGAFFAVRKAWGTEGGRRRIDSALHKVPHFNTILVGMAVGRFARVLGISLSSGLSLIEALELAGAASGRPLLVADVEKMTTQVRTGGRLTDVLNSCGYLTSFAKRMIGAGEQSGDIPRMCEVVARHYDRESSQLAKNVSTILEPILIVLIAVVVLAVALAIFLPMWNMVQLMS